MTILPTRGAFFEHLREIHGIDGLVGEAMFDEPENSPDHKHTDYRVRINVRKGEQRRGFVVPVFWKEQVYTLPWYEFIQIAIWGKRQTRWVVDDRRTMLYVADMVKKCVEEMGAG